MSDVRMVAWAEGDRLLRFRAERSPEAEGLFGAIPRDREQLVAAARARIPDPERRRVALAALRPRWEELELPAVARKAIARLEDPETRIVIAGQQPALWGGPLMLAIKALSVIRVAEELTSAGLPAVPLFWIASEDHDAKEFRGGSVVLRDGPPVELGSPFDPGRRMLGTLEHRHDQRTRLAAIEPLLAAAPHGDCLRDRLSRILADRPVDEFQKLWIELFGGRGLLPVRPEWLRSLARPWIESELAAPGALAAEVDRGIARLSENALPVPIPEPAEFPFFWVDGEGARHRLRREGEQVRIGGRDGQLRSISELSQELVRDPDRASPDALLRPLVQDAILEPAVSVLGPTEFAYHLELLEAYPARNLQRPVLLPRARVRILDRDDEEILRGLGIDPASLAPGDTAADRVPSPEAGRRREELSEGAERFVVLVEKWAADDELEPALRKRCDRLGRRLRDDLRKLGDALGRGAAQDVVAERLAVERVLARLFPGGEEGERSAALLGFLLDYGESGLDAIHRCADPGDGQLRLLVLDRKKEICRDGV